MTTHISLSNYLNHLSSDINRDGVPEQHKLIYINVANFILNLIEKTGIDTLDVIPPDAVYLTRHEKHVFSQFGEDGIIEKIFELIGETNKKYLEFGATTTCNNTKNLHVNKGFTGTLWGSDGHECDYNTIHKEFVTVENIGELCTKYEIDKDLDFLSIDIDGNDWYVWRELSRRIRPRVVVIEYNGEFRVDDDKIIPYDPTFEWDRKTKYFGATLRALFNLARSMGYSLVTCNRHGNNAFFVRDDCLDPSQNIYGVNDYKLLYHSLHSTGNSDEYYEEDTGEWLSSSVNLQKSS